MCIQSSNIFSVLFSKNVLVTSLGQKNNETLNFVLNMKRVWRILGAPEILRYEVEIGILLMPTLIKSSTHPETATSDEMRFLHPHQLGCVCLEFPSKQFSKSQPSITHFEVGG